MFLKMYVARSTLKAVRYLRESQIVSRHQANRAALGQLLDDRPGSPKAVIRIRASQHLVQ